MNTIDASERSRQNDAGARVCRRACHPGTSAARLSDSDMRGEGNHVSRRYYRHPDLDSPF
jgi:hypothetical protein